MPLKLQKNDTPSYASKEKKHPFVQEYKAPFPKGKKQERMLTKHAGMYFTKKLQKI